MSNRQALADRLNERGGSVRLFRRLILGGACIIGCTLLISFARRYFDTPLLPDQTEKRVYARSSIGGLPEMQEPAPVLDAPTGSPESDDGVVDAAVQFASLLVRPRLKHPDSAEFPTRRIQWEAFAQMNFVTGIQCRHWFIEGVVEARNDYGVQVARPWRVLLRRSQDRFSPVVVTLDGKPIFEVAGYALLLQDSRRTEAERKTALEEDKKAKKLAADRALWQAKAASKTPEQKAQVEIKLAKELLRIGRDEPAERRFREIIEKYPGTETAREAEQLLQERFSEEEAE